MTAYKNIDNFTNKLFDYDYNVKEYFVNNKQFLDIGSAEAIPKLKDKLISIGGQKVKDKLDNDELIIKKVSNLNKKLKGISANSASTPTQPVLTPEQIAAEKDRVEKLTKDYLIDHNEMSPQEKELKEKNHEELIASLNKATEAIKPIGTVTNPVPNYSSQQQQNPSSSSTSSFAPKALSAMTSMAAKRPPRDSSRIISKYLDKFENFVVFITKKNEGWLKDATASCADIKLTIQAAEKEAKGDNPESSRSAKESAKNRMYLYYKKMINMYTEKANTNWEYNKQYFIKSNRKSYAATLDYLKRMQRFDNPATRTEYNMTPEQYNSYTTIKTRHESLLNKLSASNKNFFQTLSSSYSTCTDVTQRANMLDRDRRDELVSKSDVIGLMMLDRINKLNSLYSLNYSAMELIFDTQFFLMYVIKGIRIMFTYIALFLATRVFSPIYEEAVYDQKGNPPALSKYLLIFFAFDISFNVFLIVLLYLLTYLFKSDDNSFPIDNHLFTKYLTDYVISMVILIAAGFMIGKVMMEKKYFKYRYEGLRAIRAYESMMFSVAIVLYMVPSFMMV